MIKDLLWSELRARGSNVEFTDTTEGFAFQAFPSRVDTPVQVTNEEIEANADDLGALVSTKLITAGF